MDLTEQLKNTYIGVDLGGTKLLIGEMDRQGNLLRSKKYPSGILSHFEAQELIQRGLDEFLSHRTPGCRVQAIGIGMIGRIDSDNGVWHEISSVRTGKIEIAKILSERYGLPCFVDNDVRSATKAEMLFGYGRSSEHFVYINIGTGIAAGVVSDGRLIRGAHYNAGEVGHTTSGVDQLVPCECERLNCVESVASGMGLDICARMLAAQYPDSRLTIPEDGSRVSVAEIFSLYETDALCRRLTDNAAEGIANLIMNLVRFSDPDTVVLGGGVVSDGFLLEKIKERLTAKTIRYVTQGIVITKLDPRYIGLLGACSNAIKGLERAI